MTFILPIKHLQQTSHWDCGVTCLRMLVDFYHEDFDHFQRVLDSYQCNQSTWTIDLLHLLHQMNIHAILHTITVGCSSTYEHHPYYEDLIDQDRERVNRLFELEASNVRMGSIDWEEIKRHLIEYRTPCLVLVDANQLGCCACKKNLFHRLLDKFLPKIHSSYQGHYILVIGFIQDENEEYIRYVDPGERDPFCTITRVMFDRARKAFGTDEDLIFCYPREKDTQRSDK